MMEDDERQITDMGRGHDCYTRQGGRGAPRFFLAGWFSLDQGGFRLAYVGNCSVHRFAVHSILIFTTTWHASAKSEWSHFNFDY